jgi:hypothetical protein
MCLQVNLKTDPRNCGECSKQCALLVQNAEGITCSGGVCNYTLCSAGFGDCDEDRSNGCEVRGTAGRAQGQQQQQQRKKIAQKA